MEGMISLKVPEGEMMNVEKEVKGEEGNKGSEVIVNVNGENNGVDNQKEITEIQIIVPEKDEKIKMDENKDNVVKNKDDIKENEDDDSDWEAEFKKNKKTKNNVETDNKIEDYISNGTIVVDKMEDDENSDWEKDFKEGKLKN